MMWGKAVVKASARMSVVPHGSLTLCSPNHYNHPANDILTDGEQLLVEIQGARHVLLYGGNVPVHSTAKPLTISCKPSQTNTIIWEACH